MDCHNEEGRPAIADEVIRDLARQLLALEADWRKRLEKIEPDPVRRERLVDQVGVQLLERCFSGRPPRDLKRWFDCVVRNLWKSPSKLARRTHDPLDPEAPVLAVEVDFSGEEETSTQESLHDWLLRIAPKLPSHLTTRKQRIVDASIVARTDYQAADEAGEQIANYKRARWEVGRKIRSLLERGILPYPSITLENSNSGHASGRDGEPPLYHWRGHAGRPVGSLARHRRPVASSHLPPELRAPGGDPRRDGQPSSTSCGECCA